MSQTQIIHYLEQLKNEN
jgi:predicted RNase H-like nuclease (RuvC/YqgF family)